MDQSEVKVTGGVGWFFFALIPGAIAGALLMYMALATGIVDWQRTQNEAQQAQQKAQRIDGRMDNRVGVFGKLTAAVPLTIKRTGCVQVSRAYLDGGVVHGGVDSVQLSAFVTSSCPGNVNYWEIHFKAMAPDGTIIKSDYTNQGPNLEHGQTVEMDMFVPVDERIASVSVWAVVRD